VLGQIPFPEKKNFQSNFQKKLGHLSISQQSLGILTSEDDPDIFQRVGTEELI